MEFKSIHDVKESISITEEQLTFINKSREIIKQIIEGKDDRLLMIVGPCSLHSISEMKSYAQSLLELSMKYHEKIYCVLRVYGEKARSTGLWKGYINDPDMDDTCDIMKGIIEIRQLYSDIIDIGLPIATEIIEPNVLSYISDYISWATIGARTSESQIHRMMLSSLDCGVAIKNNTNGDPKVAVEGLKYIEDEHTYFEGMEIKRSRGNPHSHIILRGGREAPNYYEHTVVYSGNLLERVGIDHRRIMVDCSHGNSQKNHLKQMDVFRATFNYRNKIIGVMIESHINEGKQGIPTCAEEVAALKYGISITDPCVSLEQLEVLFDEYIESL